MTFDVESGIAAIASVPVMTMAVAVAAAMAEVMERIAHGLTPPFSDAMCGDPKTETV
jgi:hypothetical protein